MIVNSNFRPAGGLRGPHIQTLWASQVRRPPRIQLRRDRLELPDGDFVDLDWTEGSSAAPIVMVLHGLEGSSDSGYARGLLHAVVKKGWRGVVMHSRGCSGEPNRLRRGYCAGTTDDPSTVALSLSRRFPGVPLVAVGYSLGGNALLNWLGESGNRNPLSAAVAVSIPFRLALATDRLNRGLSRLYRGYLLRSLKKSYSEKFTNRADAPYPLDRLDALWDFRAFDHYITAPLNGYDSAEHYYAAASSRSHLAGISVPTLIVQARDDPFMTPEVLPNEAELSPQVTLEISASGGHVGFVSGSLWRPRYWLEERIPAFIEQRLASASYPP